MSRTLQCVAKVNGQRCPNQPLREYRFRVCGKHKNWGINAEAQTALSTLTQLGVDTRTVEDSLRSIALKGLHQSELETTGATAETLEYLNSVDMHMAAKKVVATASRDVPAAAVEIMVGISEQVAPTDINYFTAMTKNTDMWTKIVELDAMSDTEDTVHTMVAVMNGCWNDPNNKSMKKKIEAISQAVDMMMDMPTFYHGILYGEDDIYSRSRMAAIMNPEDAGSNGLREASWHDTGDQFFDPRAILGLSDKDFRKFTGYTKKEIEKIAAVASTYQEPDNQDGTFDFPDYDGLPKPIINKLSYSLINEIREGSVASALECVEAILRQDL